MSVIEEQESDGAMRRIRFKVWCMTDPVRVWQRRKRELAALRIAGALPGWLRRAVVVEVTNAAIWEREADPERKQDYHGPDGVGYREMYHAAERTRCPR